MATQGLFMDPQMVGEERLMQLAQMNPNQRLFMQAARGGQQLGQGLGSLFGQDVRDPAVIKATKMRELAAKYGTTTAEGLDKIAQELQATDPQMAMQIKMQADTLRTQAAKLKSEEALTQQRMREKTAADPFQQFLRSAVGKVTPESLAKYRESGDPADLQWTDKEAKINYGAEADRAAKANFGKNFSDLTQQEAKVIDDLLEARGVTKAKATASKTEITMPGLKTAGDVTGLRKDLQAITKPYQDQADAAGDAIDLANMAIKNNNFAAVSSLSRSLAKAAGEQQLSSRDVEAFGIDPSLVGRVADTVSRLSQSRPTVDTLTKLRQLAEALKKKAESRVAIEEQQLQETARVSGQFTENQINTVFRRRPATGGGNTRTTKSGVTYTVEKD